MPSEIGPAYRGDWRAVITGDEFVSAPEIGDATPTLTVKDVVRANMEGMDGKKGSRSTLVVYFKEAAKGWPMNKTNPKLIAAMFGDDVTNWIGKRITLCTAMVKFGSEDVLGIRVKGSPDIQRQINLEIKRPRRRPEQYRLVPTGNSSQPRSQSGPGQQQPQQDDLPEWAAQ